jgi:prepilin-type processing-associated H-X9-DG protein
MPAGVSAGPVNFTGPFLMRRQAVLPCKSKPVRSNNEANRINLRFGCKPVMKSDHSLRIKEKVIISMSVVLLLVGMFWWGFSNAREAARESDCRGQLTQMGLALWHYHEIYGSFPPAFVAGSNGTPAHSWRTLILPFWDRREVYANYDFSVPWNHSKNADVATYRTTTFFYGCYSGDAHVQGTTNYVAVIGDGTAWMGSQPKTLEQFTDDPAATILVLEIPDSEISWLEPEDIALETLLSRGLSSNHNNHVNALFADFQVRRIRRDINPDTLKALCTISGGEKIDPTAWQFSR